MRTIDISDLDEKVENEGEDSSGLLSAEEWNRLVGATQELQEVIKNMDDPSKKIGYLYRTQSKQDDNLYHILGFANQETFEQWQRVKMQVLFLLM